MIYPMLKGTAPGWRRCLGGVDTTAKADVMVGPGRDGEDEQQAIRKHRKDNEVNLFCLRHLLKIKTETGEGKGRDVVSLGALRKVSHADLHGSHVVGRITGDASRYAWSVMNPDLGAQRPEFIVNLGLTRESGRELFDSYAVRTMI